MRPTAADADDADADADDADVDAVPSATKMATEFTEFERKSVSS